LNRTILNKEWRKTTQHILPETKPASGEQWYDIYPAWKLDENLIYEGFEVLAESFLLHRQIIIDGYVGVFYDSFRKKLDQSFRRQGVRPQYFSRAEIPEVKFANILITIVLDYIRDSDKKRQIV
jgi:hypothetical protein